MTVSTQTKPSVYTAQDLERLSHEGHHYELIRGELRPMSPSGGPHGTASSRVSFYVNGIVYGEELGETFAAETGFFVERNPDTVKAPDFAFVSYERLPEPLPEGYVSLVPDLAVETRSPSDTAREVAEKVEEWLAASVRLVWVIEPRKRTITTHRQGRPTQVLGAGDTLDGEDVLPGLSVPVERIFPPRRN
jgi:Uma2 family endonuclease